MRRTNHLLLLLLPFATAAARCPPPTTQPVTTAAAPSAWPAELAGRTRQFETDHYVVYATDRSEAESLRPWLERGLAAFQSRYHVTLQGQGIVLAIGPGHEPCSALLQWHKQHGNQRRPFWIDPLGVLFRRDRPYCISRMPYFTESYSFSERQFGRLGLLPPDTPEPAWIGALTTDSHVEAAFDKLLGQRRQEARERHDRMPKEFRDANAPAMPVLHLLAAFLGSSYRSIDVSLMHLQRREQLFRALTHSALGDADQRKQAWQALKADTDRRWQQIWRSRPVS